MNDPTSPSRLSALPSCISCPTPGRTGAPARSISRTGSRYPRMQGAVGGSGAQCCCRHCKPRTSVTDYSGALNRPRLHRFPHPYAQTDASPLAVNRSSNGSSAIPILPSAALADPAHARAVADFFLDELLRNGGRRRARSSARSIASPSTRSSRAPPPRAICAWWRAKALMDRHCPVLSARTNPSRATANRSELLERWAGRRRLGYAIPPRPQVAIAGTIRRRSRNSPSRASWPRAP
jgi:hypothetical protein